MMLGAFDDVTQFADVAWPVIGLQGGTGLGAEAAGRAAVVTDEADEEAFGQGHHVLVTLA
jgi:hypothetical protein